MAEPEGGGSEEPIPQRLDSLFARWSRTDAPGMVVGIARDGAVLYRRGFGMASLETAVANTPATRMRIGSTSKHFTALLALLSAEDGTFDLDTPIRTWLPELTGPAGEPSARLLLQHRGGGRCYLDLSMTFRGMAASPPAGTALADIARQEGRNFAPGEAMIYNNGGYHLLSIALERAGGTPFEAQLKQRLFDPVGMIDTLSLPSDRIITPGMATLHLPAPDGGWRRGLFPSEEVKGEGAIVSTVDDMLRWMAHLRTRDRFGSPESWRQLTDLPTYPNAETGGYALGLQIETWRGARTIHHAGGVFGGSSQMLTFPDHGLDIIIMVNGAAGAEPVRLARKVADIVLGDLLDERPPRTEAEPYQALLGQWWSPQTGMIYDLVDEKGELKLGFCGMPGGLSLERLSDGRVVAPWSSLGQIELGLDGAAADGELAIGFGGETHAYRRLDPEGADKAKFAQAARGRYASIDAGCTATIAGEGDELSIRFSGDLGGVEGDLACAGAEVALIGMRPGVVMPAALSFTREAGRMSAFALNTARTRGLMFERM